MAGVMMDLGRWLLLAMLLLTACGTTPGSSPTAATTSPEQAPDYIDPGYNSCHYRMLPGETDPSVVLPDASCTPGGWNHNLTLAQACQKEGPRPDLSQVKLRLLVRYGQARNLSAARAIAKNYELDHLAQRKFGGIDTPTNLWPEPKPTPNQKDGLEFWLTAQLCHKPQPPEALNRDQQRMASNWVEFWHAAGSPRATAGVSSD